jgi:putative glycosyltransferase (TIGR04372 family)
VKDQAEGNGLSSRLIHIIKRVRRELSFRVLCLLYVVLPFKANMALSAWLRRRHGDDRCNDYFRFFCQRNVDANMGWLLNGRLSKHHLNEILYFLWIADRPKIVVSQFARIDWSDKRFFFVNALTALIDRFASGYSMDPVVRLHHVDWSEPHADIERALVVLVRRMLEHRLYGYEERMFRDKLDTGLLSLPVSTDAYVAHFYRNKALIRTLAAELGLKKVDQTLARLDAEGQYWETFPDSDAERDIIDDLHLFYAYRDLTLYSYHNGEGYLVPLLCRKTLETQERLRRSLPRPSLELRKLLDSLGIAELADVKLLWPDWAALIGHNGHLNVHFMMRQMGWWSGSPIVLVLNHRIANRTFLSLFEDICPVLIAAENVSSAVWHELASLIPFLGVSHQIFEFKDGRSMYWNDAGGMAVAEWEAEDRGYPLREIYDRRMLADDGAAEKFAALKQKWGMSANDWHVCLHMRDGAARGEKDGVGESIRNTTVDSYMDAIRYVTGQGGWVIRMGAPTVPALPKMERVIDYARLFDRSPEMDIHLMRMARMFIGTTSGFAYVASSFGIPTAMVNALSSVGLIWGKDTRFALKPVRTKEGRLLTQSEVTSEKWRWAFPTHESLAHAGLTVEENSADEILETVRETLALTFARSPAPASPWLKAWHRSVTISGFYGAAVPGAYFLEKYGKDFVQEIDAKADASV